MLNISILMQQKYRECELIRAKEEKLLKYSIFWLFAYAVGPFLETLWRKLMIKNNAFGEIDGSKITMLNCIN